MGLTPNKSHCRVRKEACSCCSQQHCSGMIGVLVSEGSRQREQGLELVSRNVWV